MGRGQISQDAQKDEMNLTCAKRLGQCLTHSKVCRGACFIIIISLLLLLLLLLNHRDLSPSVSDSQTCAFPVALFLTDPLVIR